MYVCEYARSLLCGPPFTHLNDALTQEKSRQRILREILRDQVETLRGKRREVDEAEFCDTQLLVTAMRLQIAKSTAVRADADLALANAKHLLTTQMQLLSEANQRLVQKNAQLSQNERHIAEQEALLAEKGGQLLEMRGQLAEMGRQLVERDAQLTDLRKQLNYDKEQEMAQMNVNNRHQVAVDGKSLISLNE